MGVPRPLAPTLGEVWEFVVKGKDRTVNTAFINRIRFAPEPINPASPMLVAAAQNLANAMAARWQATIRTLLHTNYTVLVYSVQRMAVYIVKPVTNQIQMEYDQRRDVTGTVATDTGTRAGDQEANFVTAGIYWDTALVGTYSRGMMRISPLVDSDVSGSVLTAPFYALLQAAATTLSAVYNDAATNTKWTPVVFSMQSLPHTPPYAIAVEMSGFATPITGGTPADQVGSQLTRKNRSAN